MEKQLSKQKRKARAAWRFVRPCAVFLVSLLIVYFIVRTGVNYVLSNYIRPVDANDATPIEVVIPSSSSASAIARILYTACGHDEPGLINSTAVFKVYVDFVGKANTMKAGTYLLSRNMTLKQIVDIICEGNPAKQTVKFTVPEGYTVEDIAAVLLEHGLTESESELTSACLDGEAYASFSFINDILSDGAGDRRYVLEGYLFPDTYEVYADATVDTVLLKMLNRFNNVYIKEYSERAQALGMTLDEIITLASMIEREAQAETDFAKVSAVFHNRLERNMQMQSCASLSYVLGVNKYTFTEAELQTVSPFNTYLNNGLPTGPICNPGLNAIVAALYPNEAYQEEGYLYFCNGNPAESNELVFSRTYEEHQQNVKTYQQYWN